MKTNPEIDALPEVHADIVRHVEAGLQAMGTDPQAARAIAWEAMMHVAEAFGGQQWYIPKPDRIHRLSLYEQIWAEFDGRNAKKLALKYKLSAVAIYQIIARLRKARKARPETP